MTDRQKVALTDRITEAREKHGLDMNPWNPYDHEWRSIFREEIRPGRGHDLDLLYLDGEVIVQITMDPYGYGAMSIGTTEWTHSDSLEECECEPCRTEYADERDQEPNEHRR